MLAAFLAMYLIPAMGWQSVYWIAVVPLFFLPLMVKHFHDSPASLLIKGRKDDLSQILSKINTEVSFTPNTEFESISRRKRT